MNVNNNKRYVKVQGHPGIRKDLNANTFLVTKKIKGRSKSTTFATLKEARHWKNTYLPSSNSQITNNVAQIPKASMTFSEAWELYKKQMLSTLESSTQNRRLEQAKFFNGLMDYSMNVITPQVITNHILHEKEFYMKSSDHKRFSFDNEIKALKAMFNWFREEVDHTFSNPILKRHKTMGRIRQKAFKHKKMEPEEVNRFFEALKPRAFWYDFARVHFFVCGRSQEPAGIQVESVDLKVGKVTIRHVVVWDRASKKFQYLKELPKNGEIRECYFNETLREIFERRLKELAKNCSYVFNINGAPVNYRQIQYNYDWALKQCGLDHKYSATHFMRHSMATLARHVTGSLDAAQAVTGHKDPRMVNHYASVSSTLQKTAVNQVEDFLKSVSSGEQR